MTVTHSNTDIDNDLFTVLDFEYTEPCMVGRVEDSPNQACPEEAVWILTVACCGGHYFFCQGHFDNFLENLNNTSRAMCNYCKTVSIPASSGIASARRLDKR